MQRVIISIIGLVMLAGGLYFIADIDIVPETKLEPTVTEVVSADNVDALILYTEDGFSPKTVEVSVGDTVMWTNKGNSYMWVASDMHPTHEVYSGTTMREHCVGDSNKVFDQCNIGDSYSFTFDKSGKWGYHDHIRANHTGTIIVNQ